MDDGSYWMLDPSRYGWEVVRVMNGSVYRFGIADGFNPGEVLTNKTFPEVYFPIKEPLSPERD